MARGAENPRRVVQCTILWLYGVKANVKMAKNAKRKSPKGPTEFLQ